MTKKHSVCDITPDSFGSDFGKYNLGPEQLTPEHMTQTIMGLDQPARFLRDWLMHYWGDCFRVSLKMVPLQIINLTLLIDTGLANCPSVIHMKRTLQFMDSFQCPSAATLGCFLAASIQISRPWGQIYHWERNIRYSIRVFPVVGNIVWRRFCTWVSMGFHTLHKIMGYTVFQCYFHRHL